VGAAHSASGAHHGRSACEAPETYVGCLNRKRPDDYAVLYASGVRKAGIGSLPPGSIVVTSAGLKKLLEPLGATPLVQTLEEKKEKRKE
jgi:hypothetical protein